ncbi:MAG: flagellin FliC [Burkholderiales bacterium]|nr:flagellin FliC [Burkholderiales bacterium]
MSLTIGNNSTSLFAQQGLSQTNTAIDQIYKRLSSGLRINSAADDPAGSAIVSAFAAQIAGNQQAVSNLNDGVSYAQTASGALGQLADNTAQLQTLAVQAGNSTLSAADRQAIQAEANQIGQSNNDIIQNTQFNGQPLLQGGTQTFQAGANAGQQINLTSPNLTAAAGSGGLYSASGQIDLSSVAGATSALDNLATDLTTISTSQSQIGAASNGFTAAANNLQTTVINASASKSAIGDTDYAAATSQLAANQILSQANIAIQAQANANSRQVLSLLK